VTNSELGFDYLRDNLALSPDELVMQRDQYFCLVDEADSILIDEARTPLIISKPGDPPRDKYGVAVQVANFLRRDVHYSVDEKAQSVTFSEEGYDECEKLLQKSMFDTQDPYASFIRNALKAKELLTRDTSYLVRDNEIVIVDPTSGRPMEGRRWSDGLHQSVEVKEGLVPSNQSEPSALVTYQALFRQWRRLCGMTGTAMTDAKEFNDVYGLRVTAIPTALPLARKDYDDAVYRTHDAKVRAAVSEVVRASRSGRPVLVGTTSVTDSERFVEALAESDIHASLLNARAENAALESRLVAQAGRIGKVTVATNMAGRGTDIRLGGNAAEFAKVKVLDFFLGALIEDPAARGRVWPPVDEAFWPSQVSSGSTEMLDAAARLVATRYSDGEPPVVEELEELLAVASEAGAASGKILRAVREAFVAVKRDFTADIEAQRDEVRGLGGLYIIGTERHESRRIDNQLRGRAGRQGDPGGSRFFLSLEDQTFKLFGGDKLDTLMQTFRLGEDIPLEAKSVTNTLNQVQVQVEEYFSEIRGQLLEYDAILSTQRDTIYQRRARMLAADADSSQTTLSEWCVETMDDLVRGSKKGNEIDVEALHRKAVQFFGSHFTLTAAELAKLNSEGKLAETLSSAAEAASQSKVSYVASARPLTRSFTFWYARRRSQNWIPGVPGSHFRFGATSAWFKSISRGRSISCR